MPQNSTVPGEALSPTQPFPTAPPPFSRQKFTADDVNPHILTPEEREAFRQRIAKARNDGPFTPIGFEEVVHMPGNQGGSNWGSTAGNPTDGSVYVIGFNVPTLLRLLKAGRDARWPRRCEGSGPGGSVRHRRLRPLSDHRQSAVHDADGLRSQRRHDQMADRSRRRSASRRSGHQGHRHRRVDQGRPDRDGDGPASSHRGRPQGARLRQRDRHADFRAAARRERRPARRRCTSSGGRQYLLVTASAGGGGRGEQAVPPTAGPTGIIAFALPK